MSEEEQKKVEGSDGGSSAATSEEATVSDLGDVEESSRVGAVEVSAEKLADGTDFGCGGDAGVTRSLVWGNSVAAEGFEEDARLLPNEILLSAAVHGIERDSKNPLTPSLCHETSRQLSPTSVTQSISSIPSPTPVEQPPKIKDAAFCTLQEDRRKAPYPRTSSIDGYNWRKYGQKQIKKPVGSRSYYRCTSTRCSAKKVECSDGLGHIIETIYRSQHSHVSPKKVNDLAGTKVVESVGSAPKHSLIACSSRVLNGLDPSTSSRKVAHQTPSMPERRNFISDNYGDVAMSAGRQQQASGCEHRQRVKRVQLSPAGSPLKNGKKAEVVVHAVADMGVSNDGYRWRKYGKKMVKGNTHPSDDTFYMPFCAVQKIDKNYYRCTSAGCLARKQIETTSDDTNAVIITCKGKHDHEKPVHRKRRSSPSASLVASAPPAGVHSLSSSQPKGEDTTIKHISSTWGSVDSDSDLTEKAMELGGEKAMESARTLLSMGLEAKSCWTTAD